jgi:dihydroorotate dehydrogenase
MAIIIKQYNNLRFKNRVGLAAGFDKNAEVFAALKMLGFGFAEVGTVTPLPQPGNTKPRIWRKDPYALINHLGFNNCGVKEFRRNILKYKKRCVDFPLFCNIGKNKTSTDALADYLTCYQELKDVADGFVINISSPNTPGLRDLQSVDFLESVAKKVSFDKPIFIKLSADLENNDLISIAEYLNSSSFAGLVLTNTSSKLASSLYHATQGGLSGEPLFNRSLEYVQLARQKLKSPKVIIGVGGIFNALSAKRMYEAGADLIEIYTSFIYRGSKVIKELS